MYIYIPSHVFPSVQKGWSNVDLFLIFMKHSLPGLHVHFSGPVPVVISSLELMCTVLRIYRD